MRRLALLTVSLITTAIVLTACTPADDNALQSTMTSHVYDNVELYRAIQLGIGTYSDAETVTYTELFAMLDRVVELRDTEVLSDWETRLPRLRSNGGELNNFDAMRLVYACAEELLLLHVPNVDMSAGILAKPSYTDALAMALSLYEETLFATEREYLPTDELRKILEFNMPLQHISDNFIFYSTNKNSFLLSEISTELESRLFNLLIAFEVKLPFRISVMLYESDVFFEANIGLPRNITGLAYSNAFSSRLLLTGDRTSDLSIDVMVHEVVHVIQNVLMAEYRIQHPTWLTEGTAVYFMREPAFVAQLNAQTAELVNSADFPNFKDIQDSYEFYVGDLTEKYNWAVRIVEFIVKTWGFEYIGKLHRQPVIIQNVFGITETDFDSQFREYCIANYS